MDKNLFSRFDQLKKEFADRAGITEEVFAELSMTTGRSFVVKTVVDTQDSYVQVDAHDLADPEERPISLVMPYHQINFVRFTRYRPKPKKTGFLG